MVCLSLASFSVLRKCRYLLQLQTPSLLEWGVCQRALVLPGFCGHGSLGQRAVPLIQSVLLVWREGFLQREHGDSLQAMPATSGKVA